MRAKAASTLEVKWLSSTEALETPERKENDTPQIA
jgi:hypothetical protein